MPDPKFEWYENNSNQFGGGTLLTDLHKALFGNVPVGSVGVPNALTQRSLHLWNDKGGIVVSDTAIDVKVYLTAANVDDAVFLGTVANGFNSIVEARSRGAYGTSADMQEAWTPIGPTQFLVIGNMPRNSRREIEVRVRPPADFLPKAEMDYALAVTWDT